MSEWGQVVTTMILVQLAAHITQWGSKDHLLRQFAISPGSVPDMWRGSMITRAIPWLICTLILTRSGLIVKDAWAMYWLLGLVIVNNALNDLERDLEQLGPSSTFSVDAER